MRGFAKRITAGDRKWKVDLSHSVRGYAFVLRGESEGSGEQDSMNLFTSVDQLISTVVNARSLQTTQ